MKQIHLDILRTLSAEDPETGKYFNSSLCTKERNSLESRINLFQEAINWSKINNNKIPAASSKNEVEMKFGSLLQKYKQALNGKSRGKEHPEVTQMFIDQNVEYLLGDPYLYRKQQTAQMFIDWHKNNDNRIPSDKSEIEIEKKFAKFLNNYRTAVSGSKFKKEYPEVTQMFIDQNVEYLLGDTNLYRKQQTVQEIINWVKINKRLPKLTMKDENFYATFLSRYRQALIGTNKNLRVYPEVTQMFIDQNVEYLLGDINLYRKQQTVQKLIDWVKANNKIPVLYSEYAEEHNLAKLLSDYRSNLKCKRKVYPEVTQMFIDQNVEYLIFGDIRTYRRIKEFQKIIDWYKDKDKKPSRKSSIPLERKYARTLSQYRRTLSGINTGHKPYPEVKQMFIEQNAENLINTRTFDIKDYI